MPGVQAECSHRTTKPGGGGGGGRAEIDAKRETDRSNPSSHAGGHSSAGWLLYAGTARTRE